MFRSSATARVANNTPKQPQMQYGIWGFSDGAIEEDAAVVVFLYRHEVYAPDTDEEGFTEVPICKHCNGPIGDRRLRLIDGDPRLQDLEPWTL